MTRWVFVFYFNYSIFVIFVSHTYRTMAEENLGERRAIERLQKVVHLLKSKCCTKLEALYIVGHLIALLDLKNTGVCLLLTLHRPPMLIVTGSKLRRMENLILKTKRLSNEPHAPERLCAWQTKH